MVMRPRLGQYLKSIEDVRLAVVSAPSGFGKTTTGVAWARELKTTSAIVSWLSLDKNDNDPNKFFNYLAYAVNFSLNEQSAEPVTALGLFQSSLKGNQLIASLINAIAEEGSEFFLFLDDFQVITDESIRESIQFLIQNAPTNFHLILLSQPQGVTGFCGAKPQMGLRLNASDLQFTEAETAQLFGAYNRKSEQASLAHSLTGGWAAALHIVAVSNIASDGHGTDGKAYRLNEDYLGNLLDLVLAGLTPDETNLVEMTCIAGRMSGPLFTALTGITQPRNIIQSVENTHSLISRISDDGYWFSCHELIRESVLSRVSESNPGLISDVATGASRWYAAQRQWSEAVAQAVAGDNRDLALQTIESCSAKLLYKGDLLTLIGWENRFNLARDPTTSIRTLTVLALAMVLAADHQVNANLHDLINRIDTRMRRELDDENIDRLHWHLQGIRAILAGRNDDASLALELSVECLRQPVIFPSLTETVRCVAGYAHLQFRQWDEFYKVLTEVSRTPDDDFTFLSTIYRQILLGLAAITQLNFARAHRYLEDASQMSHKNLGATSLPGVLSDGLLAYVHCERLEVHKAEQRLENILDLVTQSGYIDCICHTYTAAIRVAVLRRENEYALGLLEKWEKIAAGSQVIRLQVVCAYEKICFFLRERNHARAKASLTHIQELHYSARPAHGPQGMDLQNYVGLAKGQYALAEEDAAQAISFVESVYRNAVRDADSYMIVMSGLMLALAEFKAGKNLDAFVYLDEAMTLAQKSGLKATFLCQPGNIWPLLDAYCKHVIRHPACAQHDPYIGELKEARRMSFNDVAVNLTPREASVLKLIAQDKSNKEISIALKITPETVKTHLKSIFIKLDVTKRNAAVRRAVSLNLF